MARWDYKKSPITDPTIPACGSRALSALLCVPIALPSLVDIGGPVVQTSVTGKSSTIWSCQICLSSIKSRLVGFPSSYRNVPAGGTSMTFDATCVPPYSSSFVYNCVNHIIQLTLTCRFVTANCMPSIFCTVTSICRYLEFPAFGPFPLFPG